MLPYPITAAFLSVITACLILVGNSQPGDPCPSVIGEPSCVCNHPDGKIDLTPLANPTSEGPKFTELEGPNNYKYSYNPCNSYGEGLCGNVHSCQIAINNEDLMYSIASAGTEGMFIHPDGTPYVHYTGAGGRNVYVFLHCSNDGNPKMEAEGDEIIFFEYVFHLHSKHACPGGNAPSIAGPIGIVIVVLLIVGVGVYFVMGAVVMRVKYNASGQDLIPNKAFWKSLPGLLKDGTLLVFSPCIGAANKDGYSEMKN